MCDDAPDSLAENQKRIKKEFDRHIEEPSPVCFELDDPLYDADTPKDLRCMYMVDQLMNRLELDFEEKHRVTLWLASKYME